MSGQVDSGASTTLPPYVDLVLRCRCGLGWRWQKVPVGESRTVTHNCPAPPLNGDSGASS